jgi:hypothetical protein
MNADSSTPDKPTTIGTGWATVLELPAGTHKQSPAHANANNTGSSLVEALRHVTTPVPQGQLLTTRLLTLLITPDGRVFVGSVPAASLERAAAAAGA